MPSDDDLQRAEAAAASLGRATRRTAREGLDLVTLGSGDDALMLLGRKQALAGLLDGIEAAHATLPVLLDAVRWLQKDRAAREAREAERRETPEAPAARRAAAEIQDVPLALVAPFRPTAQSLESAKTDPLTALAVQAAKAMQPDASELDRARLIAMAFAATRHDMDAFWTARSQRSAKKAAGRKPSGS